MKKHRINELFEQLKGHRVLIQTHDMPDPDAIGSGIGLKFLLAQKGIEATVVYVGNIHMAATGRMLQSLDIELCEAKSLKDMSVDDRIILVDCQLKGNNLTPLPGKVVGIIDHHPDLIDEFEGYKHIEETGACATLITEYLKEEELIDELDMLKTTALSYAIRMDTADLMRGTTKRDMEALTLLFDKTDKERLGSLFNNTLSTDDLKAYAVAINGIRFFRGAGIAGIPFDCHDSLVAAVSDFVLKLDNINIVIAYALRENGIRISLRSERANAHAGEMIREALRGKGYGGGHKEMAGGFVPFTGANKNRDACDDLIDKCFKPILTEVDQRREYKPTDVENRFNSW